MANWILRKGYDELELIHKIKINKKKTKENKQGGTKSDRKNNRLQEMRTQNRMWDNKQNERTEKRKKEKWRKENGNREKKIERVHKRSEGNNERRKYDGYAKPCVKHSARTVQKNGVR